MNELMIGLIAGVISVIIGEIIIMRDEAESFSMFFAWNVVNGGIGLLVGIITASVTQAIYVFGWKNILIVIVGIVGLIVLKICLFALNKLIHERSR